jgi:predicted esterase
LKILPETTEVTWRFTSYAELGGVVRKVPAPTEVVLLLHGLGERGKRIYRKLFPVLPATALVIAPNGPFPIERRKEGRIAYGHSWYFYDKHEKRYFITQDLAKFWLRDLLALENPARLPVTIIGFSQGGYLAPLAGLEIPETRLALGLACEFRANLLSRPPPFPLVAVHGERDEVVTVDGCRGEIAALAGRGIGVELHVVPETGHEISTAMARVVGKILEGYAERNV